MNGVFQMLTSCSYPYQHPACDAVLKYQRPGLLKACALLSALLTFIVFFPATQNQFVALDDYAYIVSNQNLNRTGWDAVFWSLTSFHEGNWHPLTMLSLVFDRFVWGISPFGFHLTSIFIHCCSVYCSCFLFSHLLLASNKYRCFSGFNSSYQRDTTCRFTVFSTRAILFGSTAGALFFGLHPLRVESVAWASERKDVLCIFFVIIALLLYVRYAVEKSLMTVDAFRSFRDLRYVFIFAALALMSKPTAVSLPFILCIIDWYPLRRIVDRSTFYRSIIEKIPFFILSVAGIILTLIAQQIAMKYAPDVGFISRILVACRALIFYLASTAWPTDLTAFYMHPGDVVSFALAEYLFYAVLVSAISIIVYWYGRKNHMWTALWLYYVFTLAPVLGLIQVGGQWAADRYSYLPSIGIALLWGSAVAYISDRLRGNKGIRIALGICLVIAAAQLLFYTVKTLQQIPVWSTTETLTTRIIEQMPHMTGAPYMARAIYRNENGRYLEALDDIMEAMKISLRRGLTKTYPEIAFEQGVILKNLGRFNEALTIVEWGLVTSVGPTSADAVRLRNELKHLTSVEVKPNH
jgi:hypothetical protein